MKRLSGKELVRRLNEYRRDIFLFIEREFLLSRDELDIFQVNALKSVERGGVVKLAMYACTGPGKTAVMSWASWWVLAVKHDMEKFEYPKGYANSKDAINFYTCFWSEMSKWMERSELLQRMFVKNDKEIRHINKDLGKNWFLRFRPIPKDVKDLSKVASGIHSPYMLYVSDECPDIDKSYLFGIEQGLKGKGFKYGLSILSGNPENNPTGMLYACREEPFNYKVLEITGDPDDPDCASRVDKKMNRYFIERLGRKHPWVQSRVLGKIPDTQINSFLSVSDIDRSYGVEVVEESLGIYPRKLGIDVSGEGIDKDVMVYRRGPFMEDPIELYGSGFKKTEMICRQVLNYIEKIGGIDRIYIDYTGGWGRALSESLKSYDWLRESVVNVTFNAKVQEWEGVDVNMSGKLNVDGNFGNMRAKMTWEAADWVHNRGCLSRDKILREELLADRYFIKKDKMWVIDKDIIRKELKRSPDYADPFKLTFAEPDHESILMKVNESFRDDRTVVSLPSHERSLF